MADEPCALWFMRYYAACYELCDNEREAAEFCYYQQERGEMSALGVQFSDGRTIPANDWPLLRVVARESEESYAMSKAQRDAQPKPEMRTVTVPFLVRDKPAHVSVLASEPDWLGKS